jgi:hypothetical protein
MHEIDGQNTFLRTWLDVLSCYLDQPCLKNAWDRQLLSLLNMWRTDTANQRGGSEWEPIKILLEGDRASNKTNTASNTHLRITTQVGQVHAATEVLLDLGTNKQPPEPSLCCTSQTDGLRRSHRWHRSNRWAEPVRPVATAAAHQALQKASVTFVGPGTKTPPKHNLHEKKKLHET